MSSSGPLAERPSLSTPGSHALKNLIWCAVVTEDASLDASFLPLVDIRWKNSGALTKVAGALAYLWSRRDPRLAVQALERIAKPFAYPGGKIEHYYRGSNCGGFLILDVNGASRLASHGAVR
jgi:hypothetical protein